MDSILTNEFGGANTRTTPSGNRGVRTRRQNAAKAATAQALMEMAGLEK